MMKPATCDLLPEFRAADTKKKKKLCTKGWSCGISCISKKYSCRKNLPGGEYETYRQYLERITKKQQVAGRNTAKSSAKPTPGSPKPNAPKTPPPAEAKPPDKVPAPVASADGWPVGLDGFQQVKSLGGSTGAVLVEANGERFVIKRGNSPENILAEMDADRIYQAMGVAVPEFRAYTDASGRPVKVARYIEGKTLGELEGAELKGAVGKLREDFAVDALLGNTDVVGMERDSDGLSRFYK